MMHPPPFFLPLPIMQHLTISPTPPTRQKDAQAKPCHGKKTVQNTFFAATKTIFFQKFWREKKVYVILHPANDSAKQYTINNKNKKTKENRMIIVPVKDSNSIERALKQFKRKFEKTGINKELRRRQQFDKPSVKKRLAKEHAVYVTALRRNEE